MIDSIWRMAATTVSLLGFCILGVTGIADDVILFNGTIVAVSADTESLAIGGLIFAESTDENMLRHEYGHILQAQQLGLFYVPFVAAPSAINRVLRMVKTEHRIPYCERWADELGGVEP
jgi:hypothetical protein